MSTGPAARHHFRRHQLRAGAVLRLGREDEARIPDVVGVPLVIMVIDPGRQPPAEPADERQRRLLERRPAPLAGERHVEHRHPPLDLRSRRQHPRRQERKPRQRGRRGRRHGAQDYSTFAATPATGRRTVQSWRSTPSGRRATAAHYMQVPYVAPPRMLPGAGRATDGGRADRSAGGGIGGPDAGDRLGHTAPRAARLTGGRLPGAVAFGGGQPGRIAGEGVSDNPARLRDARSRRGCRARRSGPAVPVLLGCDVASRPRTADAIGGVGGVAEPVAAARHGPAGVSGWQ